MNRGTLSAVYSVHCGGCGNHWTPRDGAQGKAGTTSAAAKAAGWENTRAFGWLCRLCAEDTVGVISGTAAHLRGGALTTSLTPERCAAIGRRVVAGDVVSSLLSPPKGTP